jgi:hypothetical protein
MVAEADLPKRRHRCKRLVGRRARWAKVLTRRRVSLHGTSKGWATMTVGHPIEGAGFFVVEALSADLPWNAWCHTTAHNEGIVL